MKSVMNHNFSNVQQPPLERSTLKRNFGHKTTFNSGDLIPFFWDAILPGDMVQLRSTILARLQSLFYPLMDNVRIETFYFFVPWRLIWEHWEPFITGNDATPGVQTEYLIPIMNNEGAAEAGQGTLLDYMGIPVDINFDSATSPLNAGPVRAYQMCYNEWFRDENFQEEVYCPIDDGPDLIDDLNVVRKRGKRKDYFTSAFLQPQKGVAIGLSLATNAPIIGDGSAIRFYNGSTGYSLEYNDNTGFNGILGISGTDGAIGTAPAGGKPSGDLRLGLRPSDGTNVSQSHMYADLSNITAFTVEQLRQAFAYQMIEELDQRGGSRYTEYLQTTWNQRPEDFRLQRPEYLGGSTAHININAVAQTSGTPVAPDVEPGKTPQGNLAAHAQGTVQTSVSKSFVEHGYIIGIVNVTADITYQQGLEREWSRQTRFDFPHPLLMHLGEQPIYQREIYAQDTPGQNEIVWGYQERWAEYKYKPSYVSGKFRSNITDTLDAWHLALDFASTPNLGAAFIVDDPPLDRVIAVTNQPQIIADTYTQFTHTRAMPVYSTPGLMGRF